MRRTRPAVALACATAALAAVVPATAQAGPSSPTTAIVSLGDSYISGEAGRWQGNSNNQLFSRDGTDRAWVSTWWGGYYDTARVYLPPSNTNGCHRSDVAEIRSASIAVAEKTNVSCSGAVTRNVFRATNGGAGQNGEATQADQLAAVAAAKNVKVVVLSIGGNDLGFASIIAACATDWTTSPASAPHYCAPEQAPLVAQRMPGAMAGVAKSLDEVRAVMTANGYAASQYRIVLQSYPSPVPRASENRYAESGWTRLTTGGCPFWNRDLDYARTTLVGQISDNLRAVAASKGAQFLDLRDLLQGREVCAKGVALGSPSETRSEWARFLVSGIGQGDLQESFHPNAYAQRALGRCLSLLPASGAGAFTCRNTAGQGMAGVTLSALAGAASRGDVVAPKAGPTYRGSWPPRYPSRRNRSGKS